MAKLPLRFEKQVLFAVSAAATQRGVTCLNVLVFVMCWLTICQETNSHVVWSYVQKKAEFVSPTLDLRHG